jgi:membrane associated rhomboid family serine protease
MSPTVAIVVLTAAVSLIGLGNPKVIDALLLWPPAMRRNGEAYRLATYGLVHADFPHLLFNMVTLFFFGVGVEDFYDGAMGPLGFVFFYALALIASILPTYLQHRDDPLYRSLGASGAVSAVLFASILFHPWNRIYIYFIPIGIPAIVYAVLYVVYSIWSQRKGEDNVNHSAHLWGAAFGVVFTLAISPSTWHGFVRSLANPH